MNGKRIFRFRLCTVGVALMLAAVTAGAASAQKQQRPDQVFDLVAVVTVDPESANLLVMFRNSGPYPSTEITFSVQRFNNGTCTGDAMLIARSVKVPALASGANKQFYYNVMQNLPRGTFCFRAVAVPGWTDSNNANNSAQFVYTQR